MSLKGLRFTLDVGGLPETKTQMTIRWKIYGGNGYSESRFGCHRERAGVYPRAEEYGYIYAGTFKKLNGCIF